MKKVYKCDYCGTINDDREVMEEHEEDCDFNPSNKRCWSCKRFTTGCNYKGDSHDSYMNDEKCDAWEEE